MISKDIMTARIMEAKDEKGLTWEALGKAIGMSPVWTASACFGMNSAQPDKAAQIAETLGLDEEVTKALQVFPHKSWKTVPTDPLVYRLYEMVGVYGDTLKSVIHEKFGDGIMSAIDFTMDVEKQEDPKGDRVIVTLNGKFLPYKSW